MSRKGFSLLVATKDDTNQPTNQMIIETSENIRAYRLLTLKAMLKLEILGMKKSGKSAYSIIKEEFQFKGSKQAVFAQYVDFLKFNGFLA